jgi:hypothetical protein
MLQTHHLFVPQRTRIIGGFSLGFRDGKCPVAKPVRTGEKPRASPVIDATKSLRQTTRRARL